MGPWLFSSLVALVCVSLLALFFPMGSGMQLLLAFFGAVLFSACACCASTRRERAARARGACVLARPARDARTEIAATCLWRRHRV